MAEFSYAMARMDKIGGWEEELGGVEVRGKWIYTKAVTVKNNMQDYRLQKNQIHHGSS